MSYGDHEDFFAQHDEYSIGGELDGQWAQMMGDSIYPMGNSCVDDKNLGPTVDSDKKQDKKLDNIPTTETIKK